MPPHKLSAADAAVLETFVVPRYLSLYGELLLEMLLVGEGARVAHLGCRTGYPDNLVYERVPDVAIVGIDPSHAALELARHKATALGEAAIEYHEADMYPSSLDDESFSHVISLHPIGSHDDRRDLFAEASRVLYEGGQALIALPLRGSFQELGDLLREYALKFDRGDFGNQVESAMAGRPTIETLSEELEDVGLSDVDVEVATTTLAFDSGRSFFEDPVTRLLVLPELASSLAHVDLDEPLRYVREAIDKYWSEGKFELSLNVGCASARRSME
jgi:ubiquinone/menaquinone biosynthesis C-methylase UbiE